MIEKPKVLVSGASGLVGRHLLQLLHTTHEMHVLVRTLPERPVNGVTYHQWDMVEAPLPDRLPECVDAVVHLAQSPHMREYPEMARQIRAVNLDSTATLLAYAKRAQASNFVFTSTGGLYAPASTPVLETSPLHVGEGPLQYYFQTKMESERMVVQSQANFASCILRPFFVYGAGQSASMLIPRLIHSVANGNPLSLRGVNGLRINPVHASDVAKSIAACLKMTGHHVFNIAGPDILSIRELGLLIGAALGAEPVFTVEDGEEPFLVADNSAMCKYLHAPRVAFRDGIQFVLEALQ
jgi:UDP-glucose 4-epimerase